MLWGQALLFPKLLEYPTEESTLEIQVAKHVRLFLSFQLLMFSIWIRSIIKANEQGVCLTGEIHSVSAKIFFHLTSGCFNTVFISFQKRLYTFMLSIVFRSINFPCQASSQEALQFLVWQRWDAKVSWNSMIDAVCYVNHTNGMNTETNHWVKLWRSVGHSSKHMCILCSSYWL